MKNSVRPLLETDDETKAIINGLGGGSCPFVVGESYFIRATFHATGRVKEIKGHFVVLEEAAWIADSGRFADFIAGKIQANEIEPVDECIVNMFDITDAFPWKNKLPRTQK